ncbi:MAG: flagellar biosynthetic protein FliO [Pseudomonadales bacterium]|nr:flagellar biosynthetic protein FliO [Pseudomonadales bacterium]
MCSIFVSTAHGESSSALLPGSTESGLNAVTSDSESIAPKKADPEQAGSEQIGSVQVDPAPPQGTGGSGKRIFERPERDTGAAVGQMVLGLLVILLLIFCLAWLVRRFGRFTPGLSPKMKITSVVHVGNREKVVLLDAGGKSLLLGVTAQQINALHVFEQGDFNHGDEPARTQAGVSEFAVKLQSLMKVHRNAEAPRDEASRPANQVDSQNEP